MIWLRKFVKYMLLGLMSAIRIKCKIYDAWAYECILFPGNRKHQRNCEAWYAELQARSLKPFFQLWFRKIVRFYKLYCSSTNFIFVSFILALDVFFDLCTIILYYLYFIACARYLKVFRPWISHPFYEKKKRFNLFLENLKQ